MQSRCGPSRAWRFETFFLPEEMDALLRQAGFTLVEHLAPDEADRTYFAGRDDGLHAPQAERLVSAVVTDSLTRTSLADTGTQNDAP
jgi:hypothetical protein